MKNVNDAFAQRLREAMGKAGYETKPAVLEREFNLRYLGRPVTLHGVRRWLQGEALPTQDKLEVLAEWLNIAPQKLRFGAELEKKIAKRQSLWEDAINHKERETFEAFLNLPLAQRKIIREVILTFAAAYSTATTKKI